MRGLSAAEFSKHRMTENNGHSNPGSLQITVTSYLTPIELTIRCSGKKTQWLCARINMQSELRQTQLEPSSTNHTDLFTATDRQQLADSPWQMRCHIDTSIKAGECFCSKRAWDLPIKPFYKAETLSFPLAVRQVSQSVSLPGCSHRDMTGTHSFGLGLVGSGGPSFPGDGVILPSD